MKMIEHLWHGCHRHHIRKESGQARAPSTKKALPENGMMRAVNKLISGDGHLESVLRNGKDHGHDA
ncbi:MAG: hypothetical protein WBG34_14430 [Flavobacteriales bacterium]